VSIFIKLFSTYFFVYVIITSDYNGTSDWGLGEGLATSHLKKTASYGTLQRASEFVGPCEHGDEPSGSIKAGEMS
jgi:hypothetical protein